MPATFARTFGVELHFKVNNATPYPLSDTVICEELLSHSAGWNDVDIARFNSPVTVFAICTWAFIKALLSGRVYPTPGTRNREEIRSYTQIYMRSGPLLV